MMRKFTEKEQNLVTRMCALVILGSGLLILLAQFGFVESALRPDIGWIFLLLGSAFLAFEVITDFGRSIGTGPKSTPSYEIEMGIIGVGLVFTSPSEMMSYYFGGIVVLSVMIVFTKIFFNKKRMDPNGFE